MSKPRILIVSWTIPENSMGGGLLLHRHFALRNDYEIGIVTPNPASTMPVFHRLIHEPGWLSRLKRTRLVRWFNDYSNLVYARQLNSDLLRAVHEFQPDIIFNVAETWVSFQALKVARKMKIPFACYFMDWAHYAAHCHGWAVPLMDRMYRRLYRESNVAFCISDGMREELGPHPNAHVVYPTPSIEREVGAAMQPDFADSNRHSEGGRFEFLFAGNLAHWYGEQVASILKLLDQETKVSMRVFGNYHSWPKEFEQRQRQKGAYFGFKPYEELIPEFHKADAFFLPMGFDQSAELIERTSFKTKFLDYLAFNKPILIWGPEYCTAVRVALHYNSALCVTDPDPRSLLEAMKRMAGDHVLRAALLKNAERMRAQDFNSDAVYRSLKTPLEELMYRK